MFTDVMDTSVFWVQCEHVDIWVQRDGCLRPPEWSSWENTPRYTLRNIKTLNSISHIPWHLFGLARSWHHTYSSFHNILLVKILTCSTSWADSWPVIKASTDFGAELLSEIRKDVRWFSRKKYTYCNTAVQSYLIPSCKVDDMGKCSVVHYCFWKLSNSEIQGSGNNLFFSNLRNYSTPPEIVPIF